MIRLSPEGPVPSWEAIATTVAANPGAVWIVGNEPDVIWQDNLTAEQYAAHYGEIYDFLKERDASAQVAVAGVAQPTPLRLAYLDRVLVAYQERYGDQMPVDIWTIHGFILREQAGSWGVDIPPGFEEPIGRLYEIDDHDDLTIFRQNLLDFRSWMASRGYGDRPLAMTEFGILLPHDYGFPREVVANFMIGALEILATTRGEHGYAADGQRLVQWWHWYSIYDPVNYPTGNLFDPESGTLTFLGQVYAAFIGE
ncbi:MAG: hypothetical protein R3300_14320 [Candidatus Promineifilaceae bacterium]|nr:hypothetical protein [Candidatus Promineifilaceae bacterium]